MKTGAVYYAETINELRYNVSRLSQYDMIIFYSIIITKDVNCGYIVNDNDLENFDPLHTYNGKTIQNWIDDYEQDFGKYFDLR